MGERPSDLRADRILDRLVGRFDRRGHPGTRGHHPAGRHLDPGQVGEDLHDPGDRDVMLRGQCSAPGLMETFSVRRIRRIASRPTEVIFSRAR